jgi:hypothetical protein
MILIEIFIFILNIYLNIHLGVLVGYWQNIYNTDKFSSVLELEIVDMN